MTDDDLATNHNSLREETVIHNYDLPFSTFGGMRIIEDLNCVMDTDTPVAIHSYKRWMRRRCYHKRVQKKWIKRFGYLKKPTAYTVGSDTIIAHPAIVAQLKRNM